MRAKLGTMAQATSQYDRKIYLRLADVLDNQMTIMRNQAILDKKLNKILANQAKLLKSQGK